MTEYCQDHSHVIELLGRIEGQTELLLQNQTVIREAIDKLVKNDKTSAVEAAVEKQKVSPILWVIGVIGGALLMRYAERLIPFLR